MRTTGSTGLSADDVAGIHRSLAFSRVAGMEAAALSIRGSNGCGNLFPRKQLCGGTGVAIIRGRSF